jgi:hypothetical protein
VAWLWDVCRRPSDRSSFVPITSKTSIILLVAFLAFAVFRLVLHRHRMRQAAGELGRILRLLALLAIVALLTFVPVFNCCTKDIFHYDLGFYYLKTIRWLESFPIVPGLVNLQPHLGFNQSAFLLTSVVDTLIPNHRGIFFVGGLLPWLGLSLSLFAIVRIALGQYAKEPALQPIEIAYAISLPAWIFVLVSGNSSSASPDSISFCLTFICSLFSPVSLLLATTRSVPGT